jgi:uncharacterized protein (DUF4415 family)
MAKSGIKSSASSRGTKSRSPARSTVKSVASSRLGGRAKTKGANITKVSRDDQKKGKTDWARVDALSDKEIAEAIRNDPDAVPLDFDWSKAVLVEPPPKKPISIRLDEDVLGFFKRAGAGYQRRINQVLRSYMEQRRKRG